MSRKPTNEAAFNFFYPRQWRVRKTWRIRTVGIAEKKQNCDKQDKQDKTNDCSGTRKTTAPRDAIHHVGREYRHCRNKAATI